MTELTFLVQLLPAVGLVAAPIILIVRFVGGSSTDLDTPDSPWARGVQEEEPRPWRIEPAAG